MPIVTTSKRGKSQVASRKSKIIVIAAVAVAAIVAIYLGTRASSPRQQPSPAVSDTPPSPPEAATTSAEAAPVSPVEPAQPPSEATQPPAMSPREARISAATNNYVKKPGQMLTDDGRVLTFPPPKEGEFRTVHSHGKVYKCDSEGNWEDVTPRPLFDNSFEENLVGLSIEGGSFVPGMLMGLDTNAIMPLLRRDVVINEDDTDDEKAKKEAVAEMKGVILDYIEQGGTFDQFVMEMRALTVQERSMKSKALKRVAELCKAGKLDEARAYVDSFNSVIDEQGFSPLKLPPHIRTALESSAGR